MTLPSFARTLHFFVPGALDQRTGGYLYDARIIAGLRDRGWQIEVHELPGAWPEPAPAAVREFERLLRAVEAGSWVVIDGLAGSAQPAVLEAAAPAGRTVLLVHHPLGDETGLAPHEAQRLLDLERRALAAVDRVVVTSAFTARRLSELGVDETRITVVIPGTERPAERATAAPSPGAEVEPVLPRPMLPRPVLLSVGSITPRKGHDVLVEALHRLADRPWSCVIAGGLDRDAAHCARVREQITAAGLEARIRLLGEIEEAALRAWLERADLFVLPSWYEGYGMAFTEALASGLPVVGTTAGAIPFTVPEDCGLLVRPGDPGALADALRTLLDDAQRRAELAQAARRHAALLPSWTAQAEAFEVGLSAPAPGGQHGG